MLGSSGTGIEVRSGKKRRAPFACKATSRKEERRDEGSNLRRQTRWNNTHRAPGSLKKESILVAATTFLFAEGVETGI
jgi:hypothetical protein